MSGKSLGAAFLPPSGYAREDGVSHLQHRLELCPAEAGPLRGCKGRATHVCWAVVASQGRRRQSTSVPTRLRVLRCTVLQGGLQFAPRAAELTAGNAPPNAVGLAQRVLTFMFSGRNWDLARESKEEQKSG